MSEGKLPEHLSHSAVEDFTDCGEKFRLRRVERVPQTPAWALVGGSAVHEATASLDMRDFGIDPQAPTTFAECFADLILDGEERSGIPSDQWRASGRASKAWPEKENYDWWIASGQEQVDNWRRFLQTSPWDIWIAPDGAPAIELSLEWQIGGVEVKGYLDRIMVNSLTGDLAVVDLKAGSRTPESTQQLGEYRSAVRAAYGAEGTPRWGFYYLTRKAETTIPADLSKYDDGRLEYIFQAARRGIDSRLFLPHRSSLCYSCNVRDYCYAVDGLLADETQAYTKRSPSASA